MRLLSWWKSLALVLIGFCLSLIYQGLSPLEFSHKVDIGALLTVLTTLVVVVGVQYYAWWWSTDVRVEKDLLIQQARQVLEDAKDLRQLIETTYLADKISEQEAREIKHRYRSLSNDVHTLEKRLDLCKKRSCDGAVAELRKRLDSYRTCLLSDDFDKRRYQISSFNLSENIYFEIRDTTSLLIFLVNKN